jgi:UTRA domain
MRRPPEEVGRALGVASGDPVLSIRCLWTVGGQPAAFASSYVSEKVAAKLGARPVTKPGDEDATRDFQEQTGAGLPLEFPLPWQPGHMASPWPAAVQIEMGLPPPAAAKALRLAAGQPVAMVTLSFPGPTSGTAAALTIAMLRPELFRIIVQAPPLHITPAVIGGFVED